MQNAHNPVEDFRHTPPGVLALSNMMYFAKNYRENYTKVSSNDMQLFAITAILERPFVKRFTLSCQTIVCPLLSCPVLSICNVGVLRPNGWMYQDETGLAGGPWPWPHCVRWGPSSPPKKRGTALHPPIFGPCLLWPNGWMDQDGTWHGGGPWSRPHCARWTTSSPPQKGGRAPPPPIFGPFLLLPKGWINQSLFNYVSFCVLLYYLNFVFYCTHVRMSYEFCSKCHALSGSAKFLKIG